MHGHGVFRKQDEHFTNFNKGIWATRIGVELQKKLDMSTTQRQRPFFSQCGLVFGGYWDDPLWISSVVLPGSYWFDWEYHHPLWGYQPTLGMWHPLFRQTQGPTHGCLGPGQFAAGSRDLDHLDPGCRRALRENGMPPIPKGHHHHHHQHHFYHLDRILGPNSKEETLWIFHWAWGIPPGEKTRDEPSGCFGFVGPPRLTMGPSVVVNFFQNVKDDWLVLWNIWIMTFHILGIIIPTG